MSTQSGSQETRPRRSSKYIWAILIVVMVVTLAAMAARARVWLAPRPIAPASPPASAPLNPQQGTRSQVESEIITLRPTGFEPAEIARPAAQFFLVVENRSGLDAVNLRLDSENGDRLRSVEMSSGEPDWNDLLDLSPGNYLLTEADHPDWVCRITITAQ